MKKLLKGSELREGVRRLSPNVRTVQSPSSKEESSDALFDIKSETNNDTKDEKTSLKQAAFELGYSEGEEKAIQDVESRIAKQLEERIESETKALREEKDKLAILVSGFEEELTKFCEQRAKYLAVNEQQLVDLSLELLYKLAGQDQTFTKMVEEGVKAQLKTLQSAETVTVTCNEDVKKRLLGLNHSSNVTLRYIVDNSKSAGECSIGVSQSNYEVGLSARLKALEEQLKVLCERRSR